MSRTLRDPHATVQKFNVTDVSTHRVELSVLRSCLRREIFARRTIAKAAPIIAVIASLVAVIAMAIPMTPFMTAARGQQKSNHDNSAGGDFKSIHRPFLNNTLAIISEVPGNSATACESATIGNLNVYLFATLGILASHIAISRSD
jgi:hypothetical protein